MILHDLALMALTLGFYTAAFDFIIRPPRGGELR